LIAVVLNGEDVAVLTADDGLGALAIAREERTRLVLTDMVPRMDSVELCRRLQGDPKIDGTLVLLMIAARRGRAPAQVVRRRRPGHDHAPE
jgi:CheY-like chemotaxis protein